MDPLIYEVAELAVPPLLVLPLLLEDVLLPPEDVDAASSLVAALPPPSSTVQLSHPNPSAITKPKIAALFPNILLFMPPSLFP